MVARSKPGRTSNRLLAGSGIMCHHIVVRLLAVSMPEVAAGTVPIGAVKTRASSRTGEATFGCRPQSGAVRFLT